MNVRSLYTNIPQEEGINIVCRAYKTVIYNDTSPIPKRLLGKALRLILQEYSFQFNKRNYLQTHGAAMGTKTAVAFANIFMEEIEKQILNESAYKPLAHNLPLAHQQRCRSLSKQINTIQQSNLRLRYHAQMRLS